MTSCLAFTIFAIHSINKFKLALYAFGTLVLFNYYFGFFDYYNQHSFSKEFTWWVPDFSYVFLVEQSSTIGNRCHTCTVATVSADRDNYGSEGCLNWTITRNIDDPYSKEIYYYNNYQTLQLTYHTNESSLLLPSPIHPSLTNKTQNGRRHATINPNLYFAQRYNETYPNFYYLPPSLPPLKNENLSISTITRNAGDAASKSRSTKGEPTVNEDDKMDPGPNLQEQQPMSFEMTLLVKSSRENIERRNVIRKTWGTNRVFHFPNGDQFRVRSVFLLGLSPEHLAAAAAVRSKGTAETTHKISRWLPQLSNSPEKNGKLVHEGRFKSRTPPSNLLNNNVTVIRYNNVTVTETYKLLPHATTNYNQLELPKIFEATTSNSLLPPRQKNLFHLPLTDYSQVLALDYASKSVSDRKKAQLIRSYLSTYPPFLLPEGLDDASFMYRENRTDDIIVGEFIDNYYNNTLKSMLGLKWYFNRRHRTGASSSSASHPINHRFRLRYRFFDRLANNFTRFSCFEYPSSSLPSSSLSNDTFQRTGNEDSSYSTNSSNSNDISELRIPNDTLKPENDDINILNKNNKSSVPRPQPFYFNNNNTSSTNHNQQDRSEPAMANHIDKKRSVHRFVMIIDDDYYLSPVRLYQYIRYNLTTDPKVFMDPRDAILASDRPTSLPNTPFRFRGGFKMLREYYNQRRRHLLAKRDKERSDAPHYSPLSESQSVTPPLNRNQSPELSNDCNYSVGIEPQVNGGLLLSNKQTNRKLEIPKAFRNVYCGYVFPANAPHRLRSSKWFVSLDAYPYDVYPPYVTGGAILMSHDVASHFYHLAPLTKLFVFDDIYLAILALKLKIVPLHNPDFLLFPTRNPENDLLNKIASHGFHDPEKLFRIWHALNNYTYT